VVSAPGGDRSTARPRLVRREQQPQVAPVKAGGPGLSSVDGVLVQVDCLGETVQFWIQSGEKKLGFLISKANEVLVFRGGEPIVHEFQCGPQNDPLKVTAHYRSGSSAGQGLEGVLRNLELR
jgi:hypothetical protein